MKKWLALCLAVLMVWTMTGCGGNAKPDGEDTPTTTTTPETKVAPIELVEESSPEVCYRYTDTTVMEANKAVVLLANTDLTDLQFVTLSPDDLSVDEVLYTLPVFEESTFLWIDTYINDAVPTRGVVCTDESGNTYYYAITWSGKDGSIRLESLDNSAKIEDLLNEIKDYLANL